MEYAFTDLFEQLQQPDGSALAHEMDQRLSRLRALIDTNIASGLPAAEFERLGRQRDAVVAAASVLSMMARHSQDRLPKTA